MSDPTRDPLPPPFPVGTRLRYRGGDMLYVTNPITLGPVALIEPGMEVTIDDVRDGRRGRGTIIEMMGGEALVDTTRDGRSIYHVMGMGRLIDAKHAADWEVIK